MRTLLAIEDLSTIRHLAAVLRSAGIVMDQAESAEQTLDQARHYDYDLILVDQQLPDMDGCEMIHRMRSARVDTPVIMLARFSRPLNRAKAFALGADDIITVPLDSDELLARVRAVIRRSRGFSQSAISVGPLVLNLSDKSAMAHGKPIRLTRKEYAILELLMLRKGIPLTKEAFLNHLYGGLDEPEAKVIDVFICKLRRKLAEAGVPGMIGTVWGRGYVFSGPASRSAPETALPPRRRLVLS